MKQYLSIKAKYPDALLLFRVGDFYETFGDDAIKTSKILGITLTKRANGAAASVELAGFPHHAIDTYLPKLVKAGQRVAICDQLEDPKTTKKIVKRGVTELVTPGVTMNDKILNHKENNFLAAIHLSGKNSGIAFLDISTGEFYVSQGNYEYINKLLQSFSPTEVILQKNKRNNFFEFFGEKFFISTFEDWVFTSEFGNELLLKHFQTSSLKGFGVENLEFGIIAAGAALHYLSETHHDKLQHINKVTRIEEGQFVWLDRFTIKNLEMVSSANEDATTLLHVMDKTISPMGSRLLRRWIVMPLKNKQSIEERHDVIEYLTLHRSLSEEIAADIKAIGDLERLISKVATGRINPKELLQIERALRAVAPIKERCTNANNKALKTIGDQLNVCRYITERIAKEIHPEAPPLLHKGQVIADGVSEELDTLRQLAYSSKDILGEIQQREAARTGINSLKIGYNNVFGYYLEVRNIYKDKVPSEWHRKQTLVSSERYITEELKELESKILGAEEKIGLIESKLYQDLILSLFDYIEPVQLNAKLIARLDCLHSYMLISEENNYVRPTMNESYVLDIKQGRHPVIEQHLPPDEPYIANDVYLDNEKQQLIILTGPNMSGKSALLRQTALIVLMAQMGCYVPAQSADIGLVDKVFTRVGASDNISSGESTFMVEMNETASILNNISNRSLILLDEIGRGTSTYDGISIAWAIAEYLHDHPKYKAKVLFATHYHELNEMATSMKRIKNYHVSVKELGKKVIFLRKIVEGGSEHSFGIHVARMAGMPSSLLHRADHMLKKLEHSHGGKLNNDDIISQEKNDNLQLSFVQLNDPLLEQIRDEIINIDVNTLTPVEALMKLNDIKSLLSKK